MNSKQQKLVLFVSIGLFVIALTQKSYCTSRENCEYFSGLLELILGWLGVFMLHIPAFPWLANPLLIASWIQFKKRPKISFILSVIAFVFMISFLMVDEIITNEAGTTSKVISYGLGYWLWVLSSFVMVIGNLLVWKKKE